MSISCLLSGGSLPADGLYTIYQRLINRVTHLLESAKLEPVGEIKIVAPNDSACLCKVFEVII